MQTQNKILDDLSRVAGGALGALSGVKAEVDQAVRSQLERLLAEMDLVPREEMEAFKAMAVEARTRQEDLEKKVAELEEAVKKLSKPQPASRRTSVRRDAPRKTPEKAKKEE